MKKNHAKRNKKRKWSARVTNSSDALDLKSGIFKKDDPEAIARSLKRAAQKSRRKRGRPYQSAMSMLNFYINRAGHNLPMSRKHILESAKDELEKLFGKE